MKKVILENVRLMVLTLIFSFGIGIAFAWTGPTSTPPAGNVFAPINISAIGQTKQGNLWLTGTNASNIPYVNGLIVQNGNVGIGQTGPTEKLEVLGNVKATAFLYSSDFNLKKNIKPLENQLPKVLALQPVLYDWKSNNESDVGFIAQDVEKIFPEVVHTNENTNLKSIDYAKLTVFLLGAIKEQQKEIEQLKLNR
jgi:hypothetical protein